MTAAFLKDITWTAVVALGIILAFCCILAWFWSKREWNSRKIRVGMFMEREYREEGPEDPPEDEAPTRTDWPTRK